MTNLNKVKNDWSSPNDDFDWGPYEDGWNGTGLKVNKKVKVKKGDKVFCHESYVQKEYSKYNGVKVDDGGKELVKNALVSITNIERVDDDTLIISINHGSNSVVVDLNKENQFFNQFTINDQGDTMDKKMFIDAIADPEFKQALLGMDLAAKITAGDVEKASIWDGYVEKLDNEMKQQITKNSKAYWATIISTNRGGFVVDIMNTIKAFMPGSMAAANRITDFESMIGRKFEVMVESWDKVQGFVVSRKKFLKTMLPLKLQELENVLKDNKDQVFIGKVTGTTPFGVFIELDEYITGMLHKTLVSDTVREAMRNNTIEPGTEMSVYVHRIDNKRVILSDVPSTERDEIIKKREAEEELEDKAREEAKKQVVETNNTTVIEAEVKD